MKQLKDILTEVEGINIGMPTIPSFVGPKEPPNILLLQRKNIRLLSNGQKVALYYAQKINKYITIPFTDNGFGEESVISVNYDMQLDEHLIKHLNDITMNGSKRIKFKDGSSTKVDSSTAHAMLKVHSGLNEANQSKYVDMAYKNRDNFKKAADFAWKNVSFK